LNGGVRATSNRVGPRLAMAVLLAAVALAVVPLCADAGAGPAGRAAAAQVGRCGVVHASVPYSRHGNRYRWGVYVTGAKSCRQARSTLSAVMHLRAAQHVGLDNASSYFLYHGWRCDFGQMGAEACWSPAKRPYRARALALSCSKRLGSGGCPADVPRDDV